MLILCLYSYIKKITQQAEKRITAPVQQAPQISGGPADIEILTDRNQRGIKDTVPF